jgi:hypothetical protein
MRWWLIARTKEREEFGMSFEEQFFVMPAWGSLMKPGQSGPVSFWGGFLVPQPFMPTLGQIITSGE